MPGAENRAPAPQPIENKLAFLRRLKKFSWEDRETVVFAYDLAKSAHRTAFRASGERYFEHPRNVALILMDECHMTNPAIISAALLHDAMEDTILFGSYKRLSYSEWTRIARFRIGKAFDADTADIIIALTKPKIDGEEITTEEQAMQRYLDNLAAAPAETLLIKMADRLHNLRTISALPEEKQTQKIEETKESYFPIFKQALDKYPKEGSYLLNQMTFTMNSLLAAA